MYDYVGNYRPDAKAGYHRANHPGGLWGASLNKVYASFY
jgi:hypothetical protein